MSGSTGGVSSDAAAGMAQFAAESKQNQADEMAFEELKAAPYSRPALSLVARAMKFT